MANLSIETQFLSTLLGHMEAGNDKTLRYLESITPEMLEDERIRRGYAVASRLYATGDSVSDLPAQRLMVREMDDAELFANVFDERESSTLYDGRKYAAEIFRHWKGRQQVKLLRSALVDATEALDGIDSLAHRSLADKLTAHLVELHSSSGNQNGPQTRQEFSDAELEAMDAPVQDGVRLPYANLHDALGPLLPGDAVGLTAYSGSGKSTVLANICGGLITQSTPCIVFPTEMREGWFRRLWAARANVPQKIAERRQWTDATTDEKRRYRETVEQMKDCPWEIVNRSKITVEEIIARATVLRRQFSGKPVVVMVDHMHRLDYHGEDADKAVGDATQRLRDWAHSDSEGGIILMLLYQPRKPSDDPEALFKPVTGNQIRGGSKVWNELDFILSPHRRWVKVNPNFKTPWGSQCCEYRSDGRPEFAKPDEAGAKLDDEHVYLKITKRRTGGEGGTVILNIDAPSGTIYETGPRTRAVA